MIFKLAIIGEVAKKISPETREAVDLPWKEIAGFRDMAIHEYLQLSSHDYLGDYPTSLV